MNKNFARFGALALALTVAACGEREEKTEVVVTDPTVTAPTEEATTEPTEEVVAPE